MERKIGTFMTMLIVGATTTLGANLYMCQDTGASLNAIEKETAEKAKCVFTLLETPGVALLANGAKRAAFFKVNITFLYASNPFSMECHVF